MRLFVNTDLQFITENAGVSQAIASVSVPRGERVPLVLQFVTNGAVFEPDYADVTVANEAARFRLVELSDTIVASAIGTESVIESTGHPFLTGDTVVISGHTGSTPAINGAHVIQKIDANHFSIPVEVTVAGTGGTAVKAKGAVNGQFVLQADTKVRYYVIDDTSLGIEDGYEDATMVIKWLVKQQLRFDGEVLASCSEFVKTGSGSTATYTGYVNYVTTALNTALGINPPTTSDDVEQVEAMAQISWTGKEAGKTHWVKHLIRNDLTRDEDIIPASTGAKSGKTAITSGHDYVTVVFSAAYPNASWHFVGAPYITNIVDATPVGLVIVGVTARTASGFTVRLSGATDSANYKLEWLTALD